MSWIERQPAGNVNRNWFALASDAAGTHLLAAASDSSAGNGWLYTSADGGATWTKSSAFSTSMTWQCAASDADGSNLIAAVWSSRLYTSSNGGSTWTERQPVGNTSQRWNTVASDSDGSVLIAGTDNARLWISVNSGASWAETRPAGNVNGDWRGVNCSSNGSVIIVGHYGGRLYLSTNTGASWAELAPAGAVDKGWEDAACSSDGSHLIAGCEEGLYTSSNGGSSWTERRPVEGANQDWTRVASNADGSVLLAANYASRLYSSIDGGATWTEQQPAGNVDRRWDCCSNADGSYLFVGNYSAGRLYTLEISSLAWTKVFNQHIWRAAAISTDGLTIVASEFYGNSYLSVDGGLNWTSLHSKLPEYINSFAISDNGSIIVAVGADVYLSFDKGDTFTLVEDVAMGTGPAALAACDSDGSVIYVGGYLSTNSGASFAQIAGMLGFAPGGVSCDDDGSAILVIGGSESSVKISTNGGTSFSTLTPTNGSEFGGSEAWEVCSCKNGGQNLILGTNVGRAWYSLNGGTSWTQCSFSPTAGTWMSIQASSDGLKVIAAGAGPYCYYSDNGGVSWEYTPTPNIYSTQTCLATISANGLHRICGESDTEGGNLYLWTTSDSFWILSYMAGDNGYINGFILQRVANGSSGSEVEAVPDEHYYFVTWDDDLKTAKRTDANVTADRSVVASFALNISVVHSFPWVGRFQLTRVP